MDSKNIEIIKHYFQQNKLKFRRTVNNLTSHYPLKFMGKIYVCKTSTFTKYQFIIACYITIIARFHYNLYY